MSTPTCTRCGAPITADASFCGQCGAVLAGSGAATASAPTLVGGPDDPGPSPCPSAGFPDLAAACSRGGRAGRGGRHPPEAPAGAAGRRGTARVWRPPHGPGRGWRRPSPTQPASVVAGSSMVPSPVWVGGNPDLPTPPPELVPTEPPPPTPTPTPPLVAVFKARKAAKFDVSPDDAEVTVDGHSIGKADDWNEGKLYKFDGPGAYYVKLSLKGYRAAWIEIRHLRGCEREGRRGGYQAQEGRRQGRRRGRQEGQEVAKDKKKDEDDGA